MTRFTTYLIIIAAVIALCSPCWGKEYPNRWVYVSRWLYEDSDVEDIRRIAETASAHGLNGMVLSGALDRLDLHPPEYFRRLEQVKAICKAKNIEIIPSVFSIGYGWSFLKQDRNLAAGIPVVDAPFIVRNGMAGLSPEQPVRIINGGFETVRGLSFTGYRFHDKPGAVSFMDRRIVHNGRASIRFENFEKYPHGHARVMQEVEVRPNRCYRLSCRVRTDGLEPAGCLKMMVMGPDGRNLAPWDPKVPSRSDWRKIVMGFNSLSYDKVRVYVGVWGGKSGRFWVDDLEIEEVGLLNVLRRPGTPVVVRNAETGRAYEEGRDYAPIDDPRIDFKFEHNPRLIRVLQSGRIKEGQRLKVSYYHGMALNSGQVTACMSEPKIYEIIAKQTQLIDKYLAPSKYLLSMDEIRAGGACKACKNRGKTMGEILGYCVTKQAEIIRSVNPKAEVLMWADMLDPNHNARGDYWLVDGDFTGSWKHIPKDIIIVCWYYKKRAESLKFFSSEGFRTLAGAYYDGDTLENPRGWLGELDKTPGATGIMYTTWRNKYSLLGPFGDLVGGKAN